MSAMDWMLAAFLASLFAAFMWLHGFHHGRNDMRRQVVGSLRFGASLRRTRLARTDPVTTAGADTLDAVADRVERWR